MIRQYMGQLLQTIGVYPIIKIGLLSCGYYFLRKAIKSHKRESDKKDGRVSVRWDWVCFPAASILFLGLVLYEVLFFWVDRDLLHPYQSLLLLLCVSWMGYRWKEERMKNLYGFAGSLRKISTGVLALIVLLCVMRIFQVNIIPLLAFGGIGAAALGFAAKDLMENFFGGILLLATRPFVIGDAILLPQQQGIEGEVEEIGWCLTLIRDKDKRAVYLPNSLFPSTLVINTSRRYGNRILEVIRVRYEDYPLLDSVFQDIRKMLLQDPSLDPRAPILLSINQIGPYAIEVMIEATTVKFSQEEFLLVKRRILERVFACLNSSGIRPSYPVCLSNI